MNTRQVIARAEKYVADINRTYSEGGEREVRNNAREFGGYLLTLAGKVKSATLAHITTSRGFDLKYSELTIPQLTTLVEEAKFALRQLNIGLLAEAA